MKKRRYLLIMGLLAGSLTVSVFAASDADATETPTVEETALVFHIPVP